MGGYGGEEGFGAVRFELRGHGGLVRPAFGVAAGYGGAEIGGFESRNEGFDELCGLGAGGEHACVTWTNTCQLPVDYRISSQYENSIYLNSGSFKNPTCETSIPSCL
jgi:hypothetical protein